MESVRLTSQPIEQINDNSIEWISKLKSSIDAEFPIVIGIFTNFVQYIWNNVSIIALMFECGCRVFWRTEKCYESFFINRSLLLLSSSFTFILNELLIASHVFSPDCGSIVLIGRKFIKNSTKKKPQKTKNNPKKQQKENERKPNDDHQMMRKKDSKRNITFFQNYRFK